MKYIIACVFALIVILPSEAQRKKSNNIAPSASSSADRLSGFEKRKQLIENSLVKNIAFKNVGPTVMSGRVVDLEVDPNDNSHFYVAYASGGVWETKNEGASFNPIFDNEIVMTVGDIAVDWQSGVIYLGSGENNSSRSSYAGFGIFKSLDNGLTWENLGLEETHHIGRIIIHPENTQVIWVAALGHLYSENAERGLYKSIDGGKTWKKTLFINNRTGIVDLVINPEDPNELIAGAWEKDRKAWNFEESGDGSGLFKSIDGGDTWTKLSGGDSGFPDTPGMGRVGISYAENNTVFIVLDNQDRREPDEDDEQFAVDKEKLRTISIDEFLALENKDINDFLDRRRFPGKYNAVDIKSEVKKGKIKPSDLVVYIEDANTLLFETSVKGAEVYKSTNGGKTWSKTHDDYIESVINSYGYYFGQIRHDPSNPDQLYILGVPVLSSEDGGKTWKSINEDNVHVDHHALWVNPNRPGHLILGNDGGIYITKDNGITWLKCNSIPVGQFYYVNVDMAEPYNIYGGLQDNGVWKGPSTYKLGNGWQQDGNYPYEELIGGDGMQVQIDTRDNNIVYAGFQFGNYFRINMTSGKRNRITPIHDLGESPYRWNWQAPILLSSHNQDIVYFGSNKFHRSMNKGDDFETLSGDLTKGGKKGDVSYGTLSTISESPLRFGLIYVGSDDGLIHRSKDAGKSWEKISNQLTENQWVSRVTASKHVEGRVYASLNGYRWDNFDAMIYVSENFGQTWQKIGLNLPQESVNVIKEDPVNENLIYVGTDHGTYVSLDRGQSFMAFGNMPNTPVHDLVVHPRENDLIIGTHGRSIYLGDISLLQKLTPELMNKSIHLFDINKITFSERWGSKWWEWGEPNLPEIQFDTYTSSAGSISINVKMEDLTLKEWTIDLDKGLNFISYDLSIDEGIINSYKDNLDDKYVEDFKEGDNSITYLRPGKYTVTLSSNGDSVESAFEIKSPRERSKRKGSE